MIKNWTVHNFKAVSGASLDFGNLNVILGKNSVGKSSLIQSIISTSQYFDAQYPSSRFSFIGNAQDLGPASLVQNRGASDRQMSFAFSFSKSIQNLDGVCELSARLTAGDSHEMVIEKITFTPALAGFLAGGTLECDLQVVNSTRQQRAYTYKSTNGNVSIDLGVTVVTDDSFRESMMPARQSHVDAEYHSPAWLDQHLLVLTRQIAMGQFPGSGPASRTRYEASFSTELSVLGDFLRAVTLCRIANFGGISALLSVPESLKRPNTSLDIDAALSALLEHKSAIDHAAREQKRRETELKQVKPSARVQMPRLTAIPDQPHLIWAGLVYLVALDEKTRESLYPEFAYLFKESKLSGESTFDRFFGLLLWQTQNRLTRQVKYLGPMRTVHPSEQKNGKSPSSIIPIGRGGEYLAHFLHTNHARKGLYRLPDGAKETTMGKALDAWLAFFDIGRTSTTASSAWGASEYLLDGERTNQKGTGVSQILPVILSAILSAPGDLLILEQPELHLHPAHQRKLADLLVSFSDHGVQIIAETHSEYLVTRLRLLIATGNLQNDEAKVIFAESKGSARHPQVHFTVASVDKIGQVGYWPDGFFEESLEDRLLLASIQFAAEE